MQFGANWSRRKFLQNAGYLSVVRLTAVASPWRFAFRSTSNVIHSKFAYVGSAPPKGKHGIHVFAMDGLKWRSVQFVETAAPASMSLHPQQHVIYVANKIDNDRGVPCGTVEAYAIDSQNGKLTLLRKQRLSLSGINPRHLAVSPDGRSLAVAISGGAYNLVSLDKNGLPEGVSAIFKEAGCGPHPDLQQTASPRFVAFDPLGHLLTADTGCDRMSVFAAEADMLSRLHKFDVIPGSGPGLIAINPAADRLYLVNELDGSVQSYSYTQAAGSIGRRMQNIAIRDGQGPTIGHSAMAMHPSGRFLYVSFAQESGGVTGTGLRRVFEISSDDGKLIPVQTLLGGSIREMAIDKGGAVLFAADQMRSGVTCISIDQQNGELGKPFSCASVENPVSLALKTA